MKTRYALSLGKPFGIKVKVHWTFLLLIAWIVIVSMSRGLETPQILMHIVFVLALFVCVVLHELGHSLTAIKFGGNVTGITLLPIGGMAHMTKMPEEPKEEFLVSAAGPLVNIVIAILIWIYLAVFQPVNIQEMEFVAITRENFLVMLMAANIFIVVFNLIPAFPMDGGRLFRAALSIKMSRVQATRVAKDIGQVFAIFFIIAGLFVNPFLVIIGIFILLGAKGEYEMIQYQDALRQFAVEDVLNKDYAELDAEDTLGKAAEELVHISDNGFVVKSDGKYQGILTKNDIINGLNQLGREGKVKEAMSSDIEPVKTDAKLFEVFQDMNKKRNELVPVISKDELKGILDMDNLKELIMIHKAIR